MTHVVDASVVLAYALGEPGGDALLNGGGPFYLSTVNLAEVLTRMADRDVSTRDAMQIFRRLPIEHVDHGRDEARRTAELRATTRRFGLSLGDRACLALAQRMELPVLTGDRKWAELEIGLDIRLIR